MPSKRRDYAPGLHHVFVNATGNWAYYRGSVDRMTWIRLLVHVLHEFDWTCIAFCQMTTHVHAIFDIPDWSLPEGMAWLNREYGKDYNARHRRIGNLVRKRYGNRRFEGSLALLIAYVYVALNPFVEDMCEHAELWRWSSLATTLGLVDDFPFVDATLVLAEFNGSREALREFVFAQEAIAAKWGRVVEGR